MGNEKLPIEVIKARGNFHITKAEIKEREEKEIKPVTDEIVAPAYLSKTQKAEFYKISNQLQKLKIMGETDVDALARYIVSNAGYLHATKQLRKSEVKEDPEKYISWTIIQEKYFKMVRASANDLGLTITSRCKLVVPGVKDEAPKENKFKKFEKSAI